MNWIFKFVYDVILYQKKKKFKLISRLKKSFFHFTLLICDKKGQHFFCFVRPFFSYRFACISGLWRQNRFRDTGHTPRNKSLFRSIRFFSPRYFCTPCILTRVVFFFFLNFCQLALVLDQIFLVIRELYINSTNYNDLTSRLVKTSYTIHHFLQ